MRVETSELTEGRLVRAISVSDSTRYSYLCGGPSLSRDEDASVAKRWEMSVLRGAMPEPVQRSPRHLRMLDLYCGAGGLSAGIVMAGRQMGVDVEACLAIDLDEAALQVFKRNHAAALTVRTNVDCLVDYALHFSDHQTTLSYSPELLDSWLSDERGGIDIVAGGPPCQGYSTVNNHTRQNDPRNSLYLTVPVIGIALNAKVIVVENVPAVRQNEGGVVHHARGILQASGYAVDDAVLDGMQLGVAQTRRRHFLVASRGRLPVGLAELGALGMPTMSVADAIRDLGDQDALDGFDMPARLSAENHERVQWLFKNEAHDLPNARRPKCHQNGHTYPSVYGRLYWDQPAPTLTRGFMSPGRGRYVHPGRPRGLTPHEGARLQGFSDSYLFERDDGEDLSNRDYSKLVGDAVPVPMSTAVGLPLVAHLQGVT